jgi:hypothetical protein
MTNEPVDRPPGTGDAAADEPARVSPPVPSEISEPPPPPVVAAPSDITEPPPAPAPAPQAAAPKTGLLRVLSIIVIIAGAILMVAGVVTWFVVRDQLSDEKIVVSEDAPFLGGNDVNGPFSAFAQAEAINDHALEASGGLTYAELPRDDPRRDTVMTASFLRASLFTSVVAFGVAAFAFGIGILLILIGWALLRVHRVLRVRAELVAPA